MSFLLAALRKDLLARLADRAALAMWFGIPLILGGLMSLAFGGSSGPSPKAVVWLVDQDESFVSELLAGALDNPDMPLSVEPVELEDGSARIEDGQGSALIVIPAGFGQAVLEETPTELAITTNPAQTILPGIVTGLTDSLSEAHFYLHRLVGGPLQTMVDGPGAGNSLFPDPELIAMTLEINGIVSTLQDLLFPPLIEVTAAPLPPKQSEPVDPGTMLLPGIVLMSLMFIAQTMADELWAEHDAGTWSRLLTCPLGVGQLLLSKLLSGTIVMGLVGGLGLGVGFLLFDLSLARLPLALAWTLLVAPALLALFFLAASLASSRRASNLVTSLVLFPLIMAGGSFFPFDAMPGFMASFGRLTPNGAAVTGLDAILNDGVGPASLLSTLGILLAGAALCFGLALLRVHRVFVR